MKAIDSLITIIDEQIGSVIQALKNSGEYGNTVIVFTADHGDFIGEYGMMLKNLGIYEAIHRIPLILHYPDCKRNIKVNGIVESIDVFPTLCELCRINIPDTVEGMSVLPMLDNESPAAGKPYTVCEWEFPLYKNLVTAVRTPHRRMVYYGKDELGELYNLDVDPGEIENQYENPAYTSERLDMMQIICDHVGSFNLLSSFKIDAEINKKQKYSLTRLIHKGEKKLGVTGDGSLSR
jgi:arylsulfatase A-like enzyme